MSAQQAKTGTELQTDFSHIIGGEAVTGDDRMDVINPSTGRAFARCPRAGEKELDRAVAAAREAFKSWSETRYAERAALLGRMAEALEENQDWMGELLTREQGKPVGQARAEIGRGKGQLTGLSSIEIPVQTLVDDDDKHIELHYRPLGVVGIITPWNAPINLALGPIASALYTGNTIVLKPSPYTPLTTLKMGELMGKIFPPGVVNVLAGGDELGQLMTEHPDINKISFTGSVETGKKVMASCASTIKRLTLELGGNDPAIVLDDVDPKEVARKLFFAGTVNSGQVCMAVKRVYAHEKIFAALCEALAEEARNARLGDGMDPETQLGPLQNRMQYDKVKDFLEDTRKSGARILAGGEVPEGDGYFIPPTIVTDIAEDARLVREEQFGPVIPVLKFSDIDDAIARANDTDYGLCGSVWTKDLNKGAELAARLEVGTAWVNQHRATHPLVPFGGAKQSGLGRQYSILGLLGYMEPLVISVAKK
ncbi:MAG: aldehyde dehydrogenase family protein [Gammaproteobacteria bacterium]